MGAFGGPPVDDPNGMVGFVLTLFQTVWMEISNLWGNVDARFSWVYIHLDLLGGWILRGLRKLGDALSRALKALTHLKPSDIWHALKRAYERLKKAYKWYKKHVQEPIDRIRRSIMDLYNTFFKPIIRVIDTFRVFVRFISIFNRKLAAKLDRALFKLESKIMYPITAMLKRLNELSSYVRAIVTAGGLLDRVMVLETLRRDASLVWEVLTNPKATIYEPIAGPEPQSHKAAVNDLHVWLQTGGGPLMEEMEAITKAVRDDIRDILSL